MVSPHKSCQKFAIANINLAGLSLDKSVAFPYSTGFGPEVTNHSLLDERWEAIDINPGVVAIPDDWADEHNLAPTQRFPWDTSKGVYLLTAFHTLHCLVSELVPTQSSTSTRQCCITAPIVGLSHKD